MCSLHTRLGQHRRAARTGHTRLYRWWRKRVRETGVEPTMRVLWQETFATRNEATAWLDTAEQQAIAWVRAQPGARCLNSDAGGQGLRDPTPEVRTRIGQAARAMWRNPAIRAVLCAKFRQPKSATMRARLSASTRGKPKPPGHGAKVAAALRGRMLSAETRAKMSAASPKAKQTHCERGHEFTAANTNVRANGTRQCRECCRIRDRRRIGLRSRKRGADALA